jgi:hypothetical protein
MKPMNIDLHIEELVLDGLPRVDQYRFSEAVQVELSRLFSERGVPRSLHRGGYMDQLDGGGFTVAPNSTESSIAGQIAQAVYRGFGK